VVEAVIPDEEGFWSGFNLERFVVEMAEVGELLGAATGLGEFFGFCRKVGSGVVGLVLRWHAQSLVRCSGLAVLGDCLRTSPQGTAGSTSEGLQWEARCSHRTGWRCRATAPAPNCFRYSECSRGR